VNILVGYPYLNNKPSLEFFKNNISSINLLIDSGAFTAWKSGKPIKIDDYCLFLESINFPTFGYFTLDVVGNPHETMKNYETMLKRGFKPIPIFTRGESLSVLEDYYKTSDIVAIGGLVQTIGNKGFVKGIMKHVNKRKVHWLGFCNKDFVNHYRPFSIDSSSWESGAIFGSLELYIGKGKFIRLGKKDFSQKPRKEVIDHIQSYGFKINDFSKNENWSGGKSLNRQLCAASIVRYMLDLRKILNVNYFAASATMLAFTLLLNSLEMENNK
jgi:hypothetical protein